MQRNQKEERLKHIRREFHRTNALSTYNSNKKSNILVPVEKPIFAGWDITVDFDPLSIKHIMHISRFYTIMHALGWLKPRFVRDVKIIKWIRKYHHAYYRSSQYVSGTLSNGSEIRPIGDYKFRLTIKEYNKLPEECHKYFRKETVTNTRQGTSYVDIHYQLILGNNHFPDDYLVFRIKKAYWKHLIYLDGDSIGEEKRLDDKLWHGSYSKYLNKALCDSKWHSYHHGYQPRRHNTALCKELTSMHIEPMQPPWDPDMIQVFKDNNFILPAYTDTLACEEQLLRKHVIKRKDY